MNQDSSSPMLQVFLYTPDLIVAATKMHSCPHPCPLGCLILLNLTLNSVLDLPQPTRSSLSSYNTMLLK